MKQKTLKTIVGIFVCYSSKKVPSQQNKRVYKKLASARGFTYVVLG